MFQFFLGVAFALVSIGSWWLPAIGAHPTVSGVMVFLGGIIGMLLEASLGSKP